MGEKLFAVPWAALTLDTVSERFTPNVPKEALMDATGFNKALLNFKWVAGHEG